MPVGESLFRVFPCPFPFSCCQHLFRSSAFFADSFYWCSFSVFFYLFPLSCFLFFSLLFPFLRSPFLSSPFSALSFSPSCFFLPLFRSFVFAFLLPFLSFFLFVSVFSFVIFVSRYFSELVFILFLHCSSPFLPLFLSFVIGKRRAAKNGNDGQQKNGNDGEKKKKRRAAKNGNAGQQKNGNNEEKKKETTSGKKRKRRTEKKKRQATKNGRDGQKTVKNRMLKKFFRVIKCKKTTMITESKTMLRISNFKLPFGEDEKGLPERLAAELGCPVTNVRILKKAVDAVAGRGYGRFILWNFP